MNAYVGRVRVLEATCEYACLTAEVKMTAASWLYLRRSRREYLISVKNTPRLCGTVQ